MAWEQLERPELDGRLQLIAGFLANKIADRTILDLNCGRAPLLDWMPRDFRFYYGNDTNEGFIKHCRARGMPRTHFWTFPDNEVLGVLEHRWIEPHILLSLGYGPHLNEHESDTLDTSIVEIAARYKPEYVIVEMWAALPPECGFPWLFGQLVQLGYVSLYSWQLRPHVVTGDYQGRYILIMRRK